MSRGRFPIESGVLPFTSPSFGLLSPATTQLDLVGTQWRLGMQWQATCPDADGTYGDCLLIDGTPAPGPKGETWDWETRGATPVTIYSRIDCAPVGEWSELSPRNQQALIRSEERELERIFFVRQRQRYWRGRRRGRRLDRTGVRERRGRSRKACRDDHANEEGDSGLLARGGHQGGRT